MSFTNVSDTRARRFLDAFHSIEQLLQSRDRKKREVGFVGFLSLVRDSRELTSTQVKLLEDSAQLRNVIAHHPWSADGRPIADPHEAQIAILEAQLELLRKPPTVYGTLPRNSPAVLTAQDEISAFFDMVKAPHNYSQAPVRDHDGKLRLVTTNAVTRWVAAEWRAGDGAAIENAQIDAVLPFCEGDDGIAVRRKDFKVVHAVRLLSGLDGAVPAAILLTEAGTSDQTPIGICVKSDLPVLYAALHEHEAV